MSGSTDNGNFIAKLETFFLSCISLLVGKDTIVALRSAVGLSEWSDNLGITRKCIDSIVEKILTPPSKVTWSYTLHQTKATTRKPTALFPKIGGQRT
ncbi:BTB/POZ domain-containing protein [Cucurbita argyrosperma subsp. argyrosperma]|nr:BTB/POZ domain-containing protein [Cucurbita argyrosperma subsp. argyrosperma]